MKKPMRVFVSTICACVVFVFASRLWFDFVPLEWIYTLKIFFNVAEGIEATEDIMILTGILFGISSAGVVFIVVFLKSKKCI